MNDWSCAQSSRVRSSCPKSMGFLPALPAMTLSGMFPPGCPGLPASTAYSAEHLNPVLSEDSLVGPAGVTRLDERQRVGGRWAPAAVGGVEHDVVRRRVGIDADPVGVVPGCQ